MLSRMPYLIAIAIAASMSAGHAQSDSEPSGVYLREWLLCGPFPDPAGPDANVEGGRLDGLTTDYLADTGGETEAYPEVDEVVTYNGVEYTWIDYVSNGDAVYLDGPLGDDFPVVGYAYTTFASDAEVGALMAIGSNDDVRVWLNGELVHDKPGPRSLRLDDELVPVLLREGENTLLIKVEERGGRWGFSCRFLPFDLNQMLERTPLFRIDSDAGAVTLHVNGPGELLRAMVKRVDLSVANRRTPESTVWESKWDGDASVRVPLQASGFEQYVLTARIVSEDDEVVSWTMPFTTGERSSHVLFEGGTSSYSIVLGKDASESERWAAADLQHWIREVGGATLPIGEADDASNGPVIVVGYNDITKKVSGRKVTAPDRLDESFRYTNAGDDILIWGGSERGTMYGVLSFLERELGVRWYTPSVTVAPKRDRFAFEWLDHTEKPGIRVRNDFYFEAFEPTWAARNRVNGAMGYREQPGGVEAYWAVHTFYPIMPPEEFYEEHPEHYSLINGKRIHERAQLCLTNPDVLRIFTERMKQKMRELPEYLIYCVSQNDWYNACQCDDCQAIAQREGSESGPILFFVNQIAEAVEKEFPDKFIGTLAYQYTRKPPKTLKPRDNVVIRFCSIECCFAHPFTECPENVSFVEDMDGWAAIAPHIYIWDYVVNFSHYVMPYPNFRVLQPNIQFFRDHNSIGIMEQAAYQSRGGEFAELRAYVIAKLLWNPEADVPAIIDDFMYGYYGRSGQYVRAYFDLLHAQLTANTHIHLGLQPDDPLFTDAFIEQADRLFDDAESVADSDAILARVELARLPLLYLKCRRDPVASKRDGTYERLVAIQDRESVTHYAESGAPHKEAFHEFVQAAE